MNCLNDSGRSWEDYHREAFGLTKKIARLIGWLMILCLAVPAGLAEDLSRENWYGMGIASLEEMTAESVTEAIDYFGAAGKYGRAKDFKAYAQSLSEILTIGEGTADPGMTMVRLQDLEQIPEFTEILATYDYPSCTELITYLRAYQSEQAGDYYSAWKLYAEIREELDALERMYEMIPKAYEQADRCEQSGDYETAAAIFRELNWKDSEERYRQADSKKDHLWQPANCEQPRTCLRHGETEGEPLGHDWEAATCTEKKRCRRCGITEGQPLGHKWHQGKYADFLTCTRCGATQGTAKKITAGSVIPFGTYEQDNNLVNGREPVEWIVLSVRGREALLISRYALDIIPYHTELTDITWENSSLREWLNEEFRKKAFTYNDQTIIIWTDVDNSDAQGNSSWKTTGGNNSRDRIFLLSCSEANDYLAKIRGEEICTPTKYAAAKGEKIRNLKSGWWLRSPGYRQNYAAYVDTDGSIHNTHVNYMKMYIRPVLWLNLDKYFLID